jgi:outer membrane cobalamin receptor
MASATLILATGFSAHAQDAAGKSEPERVEKVVVTAQKRAQKLKDVPLPVQSISKSQIDNSGASAVARPGSADPGSLHRVEIDTGL